MLLCGGCKSGADTSLDPSEGDAVSALSGTVSESSKASSAPVYYFVGPTGLKNMAVPVENKGLILPDVRFISKEYLQFEDRVFVLPVETTIICYYDFPSGPALPEP